LVYTADILNMTVHTVDGAIGKSEPLISPSYGAADEMKVGIGESIYLCSDMQTAFCWMVLLFDKQHPGGPA